MSRPSTTRRSDAQSSSTSRTRSETAPSAAAGERLRCWGALVASGEAPLPEELEPAELKIVLAEAGRLRRQRLIRFIARAIAQDIHVDREP